MMNPLEIKEILKTFEIVIDNREQETPRASERYKSFGVPYSKSTISYGDYAGNITFPNGKKLNDTSETIHPTCVVERKMNLDELASCFTNGRERFEKEFKRALDNNARIFLLVEDASWENLINGRYRSMLNANAFIASVIAWTIRYNMVLIFCKQESSPRLIKEILYRDIKERLEKGEFDER